MVIVADLPYELAAWRKPWLAFRARAGVPICCRQGELARLARSGKRYKACLARSGRADRPVRGGTDGHPPRGQTRRVNFVKRLLRS